MQTSSPGGKAPRSLCPKSSNVRVEYLLLFERGMDRMKKKKLEERKEGKLATSPFIRAATRETRPQLVNQCPQSHDPRRLIGSWMCCDSASSSREARLVWETPAIPALSPLIDDNRRWGRPRRTPPLTKAFSLVTATTPAPTTTLSSASSLSNAYIRHQCSASHPTSTLLLFFFKHR